MIPSSFCPVHCLGKMYYQWLQKIDDKFWWTNILNYNDFRKTATNFSCYCCYSKKVFSSTTPPDTSGFFLELRRELGDQRMKQGTYLHSEQYLKLQQNVINWYMYLSLISSVPFPQCNHFLKAMLIRLMCKSSKCSQTISCMHYSVL